MSPSDNDYLASVKEWRSEFVNQLRDLRLANDSLVAKLDKMKEQQNEDKLNIISAMHKIEGRIQNIETTGAIAWKSIVTVAGLVSFVVSVLGYIFTKGIK